MSHSTHEGHSHAHGPDCGHVAIRHGGHVDYLHDGHMHHDHEGHVDECQIEIGATNPEACRPAAAGESGHAHGADCGHPAVPHGDHTDYLVDGVLHHPHGDHCDDHGRVDVV